MRTLDIGTASLPTRLEEADLPFTRSARDDLLRELERRRSLLQV